MNNEDRFYHKVAAVVLSLLIAGVAIYGSYMPMRKAQMFISALQGLQTTPATSLSDLEGRLSPALNYPSPIGQEELVRNMANSVLSFVQSSTNATSTAALIAFLNSYYNPILAQGKGMSFGQDVYLEGAVNEVAFVQTNDPTYLEAAQHWYSLGNTLGPDRPQPLYGLFDVYRAAGDVSDTLAIGNKILSLWPTDTRIQAALTPFEATSSSTASSSGK
jgi:hypothetical protein